VEGEREAAAARQWRWRRLPGSRVRGGDGEREQGSWWGIFWYKSFARVWSRFCTRKNSPIIFGPI
jgi:hypothetical protein